jgi:hypothetical protein
LPAPGNAVTSTTADGNYLLPVNFEAHCKACHPLTLRTEALPSRASRFEEAIPHGLTSPEVGQFLRRIFAEELLANDLKLRQQEISSERALPDKPESPQQISMRERLQQAVRDSLVRVRTDCLKCHIASPRDAATPDEIPAFESTSISRVWFRHARFDHSAHRAVSCLDCHPASSAAETQTWIAGLVAGKETKDLSAADDDRVLIPGLEKCVECHAPARMNGERATGGARFDCVECHTYHDGHAALGEGSTAGQERRFLPSGVGSAKRDGTKAFSAAEFLSPAAAKAD